MRCFHLHVSVVVSPNAVLNVLTHCSTRTCSMVATTDSTPSALTALLASMRWMLTSAMLMSLVFLTSHAKRNGRIISCKRVPAGYVVVDHAGPWAHLVCFYKFHVVVALPELEQGAFCGLFDLGVLGPRQPANKSL